jgi:hypothetical protein
MMAALGKGDDKMVGYLVHQGKQYGICATFLNSHCCTNANTWKMTVRNYHTDAVVDFVVEESESGLEFSGNDIEFKCSTVKFNREATAFATKYFEMDFDIVLIGTMQLGQLP